MPSGSSVVMVSENVARLAVLIDADNAKPGIAEDLLAEVAKYGTAHVKRAYGDWTGTSLRGWKEQLLAQSIQPIQQFAYTTGKNATDSAMVIDAMDLLYSGKLDGFCIVSSDSDFTRLAARLRESGMTVYGFGERKTPKPFVAASDDDGWAPLSSVGNIITNQRPDFDSRSYGYGKLSDLIKATTLFEVERHSPGDGKQALMYAREKPRAAPARKTASIKTADAKTTRAR